MVESEHKIIAIVEGKGERDAVPGLLRRILGERRGRFDVAIPPGMSTNGKINLINQLERFLRTALIEGCDGILVLVDTDTDDCPRDLAYSLSERAATMNLDVPVAIVCPNSEYETWLICSLSDQTSVGIRGRLDIDASIAFPDNVEQIRDAKGWLRFHSRQPYKPTSHQAALTHQIDLDLVHSRSRSFRRLCQAVDELIDAIAAEIAPVTPSIPSDTQPCPSS